METKNRLPSQDIHLVVRKEFNPPCFEFTIWSKHPSDNNLAMVARLEWDEVSLTAHHDPTIRIPLVTGQYHVLSRLACDLKALGFIDSDSENVIRAKDAHIKSLDNQIENLKLTIAWMSEAINDLEAGATRVVDHDVKPKPRKRNKAS